MTDQHKDDVVFRAHTAFKIGEIDLAEKLILSLGEILPRDPSIFLLLGNIRGKRGRFTEAEKYYKEVLNIDSANAEAHNNLGVIYRQMGRMKDAISELEKAADADQNRADIFYNLGNAFKQSGKLEKAADAYEKAIGLNPSFTLAYNNLGTLYDLKKDFMRAEEIYRKGLESDRNSPSLKYNLGLNLQNQQKDELARDFFRDALKARPGWIDSLNNLGIVLQKLGDTEGSIQAFKSILRREPKNFTAKNNLGTVLHASGRTEEAERLYRQALSDNPRYVKAGLNLGSLLHETGSMQTAYLHLLSLLKTDPGNVETRLLLAMTAQDLGKDSESEAHLTWILSQEPENTRALRQMGLLLFKRGDSDGGERFFRKILQLEPQSRKTSIELAAHFRNCGKFDAAVGELNTILVRNSEDTEVWLLLADLYLEKNEPGTAADIYRRILEKFPENTQALHGLARAYHAMGATRKAAETASTLINLQGNRATPEDLATISDSLDLYEEVIKPYEQSFDSSWEKSLRHAVLQDSVYSETSDSRQVLEDENDSLLFSGNEYQDEFAPTLLDLNPAGQDRKSDGETAVPAERPSLKNAIPEENEEDIDSIFRKAAGEFRRTVSAGNPEHQPPVIPDYKTPSRAMYDRKPTVRRIKMKIPRPPRNEAFPNPETASQDQARHPRTSKQEFAELPAASTRPREIPGNSSPDETTVIPPRKEPDFTDTAMKPDDPVLSPVNRHMLPELQEIDEQEIIFDEDEYAGDEQDLEELPEDDAFPDESGEPEEAQDENTEPLDEGEPGAEDPEDVSSEDSTSEEESPDVPIEEPVSGDEPLEENMSVPIDDAEPPRNTSPGGIFSTGNREKPANAETGDDSRKKEAMLLEHLLALSEHVPASGKNDQTALDMRLKIEQLKARLLGRQGLKKKIENRPDFHLPDPPTEIKTGKVVKTFEYLSNLVDSYPDSPTGIALKTKVSHILFSLQERTKEQE